MASCITRCINGQLMKADGGATDANITLSGNTWNGKTDSEVLAGIVGTDWTVR